jgi:hypothetical protein
MIFFSIKFFQVFDNRKEPDPELEPEPQFVISAPASAATGNLMSAPWLWAPAPQHCFR